MNPKECYTFRIKIDIPCVNKASYAHTLVYTQKSTVVQVSRAASPLKTNLLCEYDIHNVCKLLLDCCFDSRSYRLGPTILHKALPTFHR